MENLSSGDIERIIVYAEHQAGETENAAAAELYLSFAEFPEKRNQGETGETLTQWLKSAIVSVMPGKSNPNVIKGSKFLSERYNNLKPLHFIPNVNAVNDVLDEIGKQA